MRHISANVATRKDTASRMFSLQRCNCIQTHLPHLTQLTILPNKSLQHAISIFCHKSLKYLSSHKHFIIALFAPSFSVRLCLSILEFSSFFLVKNKLHIFMQNKKKFFWRNQNLFWIIILLQCQKAFVLCKATVSGVVNPSTNLPHIAQFGPWGEGRLRFAAGRIAISNLLLIILFFSGLWIFCFCSVLLEVIVLVLSTQKFE